MKHWIRFSALVLGALTMVACTSMPDGVKPVKQFELQKYLGKWYEVARLDHSFERGLSRVTAQYSIMDDGGVRVINRGFDESAGEWSTATGKAYFVGEKDTGHLKVSFFGPFYGAYVIIELDKQGYQYALVSGPNRDYLWILARNPELDADIVERLVQEAASLGYPTDELIWLSH